MKLLLPVTVGILSIFNASAKDADSNRYSIQKPNFSYWNDTNDDILTEFKTLMTVAEHTGRYDRQQGSNLRTLQRFAELVDMIMYLQQVPFFGQYWYYGCWCAPEGFLKTVGNGYGKPVDQIDRSCKAMSECYECAQMDHGSECSTTNVNYRWRGTQEASTEKGLTTTTRGIMCDDPVDSCQHTICSCDKKLAEDLAQFEKQWNLHNHQKWGDFNRDEACHTSEDRFGNVYENAAASESDQSALNAASRDHIDETTGSHPDGFKQITTTGGDGASDGQGNPIGQRNVEVELDMPSFVQLKFAGEFGHKHVKACCGKYPNRFPYKLDSKNDCCNNNYLYHKNFAQCCSTGEVKKAHEGNC